MPWISLFDDWCGPCGLQEDLVMHERNGTVYSFKAAGFPNTNPHSVVLIRSFCKYARLDPGF